MLLYTVSDLMITLLCCPSCHVLNALFWLFFPFCSVQANLRLSCRSSFPNYETTILSRFDLSCVSCQSGSVLVVLTQLSCSGHPILSVLSRLYICTCWPVETELSQLYSPSFPVPVVMHRMRCQICPATVFLPRCPFQLSCPVAFVLSSCPSLSYSDHPVLSSSVHDFSAIIDVPTVPSSCPLLAVLSPYSRPLLVSPCCLFWLSCYGYKISDSCPICPVPAVLGCPEKTDFKN